jgi:dodecin
MTSQARSRPLNPGECGRPPLHAGSGFTAVPRGPPFHACNRRRKAMSMLKVIEVLAESPDSFDAAADAAVTQASETLRGIESVYIKEMSGKVEGGRIVSYRVNAKITFRLEDEADD